MRDLLVELLLPRTDAGAGVQLIAAVIVFSALAVLARRSRDLLWFVGGIAMATFAWFALRTLH